MQVSPAASRRLNRHEIASAGFVAAAVTWAILTVVAAMWYATPRAPWVSLGSPADFPPSDSPYRIAVGRFRVWVVNTGNQFIVFDPRTPTQDVRHRYVWVESTRRFEDPLSGSEFTLTGDLIEGPALRGLDRYAYRIVDHEIQVETWRVIEGYRRSGPLAPCHERPACWEKRETLQRKQ
jgi:hypothetical protein